VASDSGQVRDGWISPVVSAVDPEVSSRLSSRPDQSMALCGSAVLAADDNNALRCFEAQLLPNNDPRLQNRRN